MKLLVKKLVFTFFFFSLFSSQVLAQARTAEQEMLDIFFGPSQTSANTTNLESELDQLISSHPRCTSTCIGNRGCFNSNGRAFFNGMVETMIRSACRSSTDPIRTQMVHGHNTTDRDALASYFTGDRSDRFMLVSTKLLTLSLGMWESSGRFWEGVDVTNSASQSRAVSAEAGLFQTSYDVRGGGNTDWARALAQLEEQYRQHPELCMTATFTPEEGVGSHRTGVGTGVGRSFQDLMRRCPALAAEHAMITIRHNRRHYGPLNRRDARPVEACRPLFETLYDRAQQNPSYCAAFGIEGGGQQENPFLQTTVSH